MKRQIEHHDDNSRKQKRSSNKKFPYVLTIIDMQPTFKASNTRRILNHIRKLIISAKKDNAFIIYAEYRNCGPTHESLTKLTDDYKHRSFVNAYQNSKSDAIVSKLTQKKIISDRMIICGVNTDACVQATVLDLSTSLPNWSFEIIKDGCYTCASMYPDNKYYHDVETLVLRAMNKLSNVSVI